MATPVIMPKQGQSVESCIMGKWNKKKGAQIAIGDVLFSYETDKASFEEEAKVSGILLDVFFDEGDDVPCLTNVCVIGNEGESTSEFNPHLANKQAVKVETVVQPEPQNQISNQSNNELKLTFPLTEENHTKISPRARNLAEKTGVDYRLASPSGPNGRIIEKDIIALKEAGVVFTAPAMAEYSEGETGKVIAGTGLGGMITTADLKNAAVKAGSEAGDVAVFNGSTGALYEEVKLPNIRKVIAKTMQNSLASSAQLTLNSSFDATDILEFRRKVKERQEQLGLENITINDIIIYVVSRTLLNHKDLNAHFLNDRMLYFKNVNLGVAIDTERGLMVPTLWNANQKSLNEISLEVKKHAKDCQLGTINPDLLKNGSFTVTNLGTLGIESFTPILNPPQTGILGVNNMIQRARDVAGKIEFYPAIGLSLTFDHRALDGAPAARFLKELISNLENFSILLAR